MTIVFISSDIINCILTNTTSFCQQFYLYDDYNYKHHPLPIPEASLPWIWDAVYDNVINEIIITTITRKSCEFEWPKFYFSKGS